MSTSSTPAQAHKIHPLSRRIAESVAARASQVKALIRERRKIALTFRRTQDERDRAELEHIDQRTRPAPDRHPGNPGTDC